MIYVFDHDGNCLERNNVDPAPLAAAFQANHGPDVVFLELASDPHPDAPLSSLSLVEGALILDQPYDHLAAQSAAYSAMVMHLNQLVASQQAQFLDVETALWPDMRAEAQAVLAAVAAEEPLPAAPTLEAQLKQGEDLPTLSQKVQQNYQLSLMAVRGRRWLDDMIRATTSRAELEGLMSQVLAARTSDQLLALLG